MDEFALIKTYFDWQSKAQSLSLGVGDDCAIIDTKPNTQIVTSVDTLVEGVHFPENTSAEDIAYKSLAVSLSDLAAMGAMARYFTLALTLPALDKVWLDRFSTSLKQLADSYNIRLIGGDTTRGALSISISVIGEVAMGKALLRSSAKIGDGIFVSGCLGGAALAFRQLKQNQTPNTAALKKFNRPLPRIDLGLKINHFAHACIDISDGLAQDLSHILDASKLGAEISSAKLPIFAGADLADALYGGDDYELCFTAPSAAVADIKGVSQIGIITREKGLKVDKKLINHNGYQHF